MDVDWLSGLLDSQQVLPRNLIYVCSVSSLNIKAVKLPEYMYALWGRMDSQYVTNK